MTQLVWLVPALPLAGFLINGLFRNQLSKSLTGIIGCGTVLAAFVVSLLIFSEVRHEGFQTAVVTLFDFITVGKLSIPFAFQVDQLSSLFLLIITGVGFLIHLYSTAYMHDEKPPHFARYFSYLNLFVFSMLLLVLGANFVILFIGWEGVGLCSYLLIGYWFQNIDYGNAAKKAFIMNRIGDLGFLIAIFFLISKFGSVDFDTVFGKASSESTGVLTAITLLLFVGATGKSAQIPLYTWLPDAMAGPTPVSALIHAATMVTAGESAGLLDGESAGVYVPWAWRGGIHWGRVPCDDACLLQGPVVPLRGLGDPCHGRGTGYPEDGGIAEGVAADEYNFSFGVYRHCGYPAL